MEENRKSPEHRKSLIDFAFRSMDEPNGYSQKYVAFLDILGFKEIINEKSPDWIKLHIYDEVRKVDTLFHSDLYGKLLPQTTCNALEFVIISDSIIISLPITMDRAFETFFMACVTLQRMFLRSSNPILLRGAISKGDYFHYDHITFGPALTQAYLLESSMAIYPRVIIDNIIQVSETGETKGTLLPSICLYDGDGFQYLDYVRFALMFHDDDGSDCMRINQLIISCREKYKSNPSIYGKYNWLANKFNSALEFVFGDSKPNNISKYKIPNY